MFLTEFTGPQKEAFLVLAKEVVWADEQLVPQEEALLSLMKREMELDSEAELPDIPWEETLPTFDSRRVRVSVLLELLGLALSDEDYHEKERALIETVAKSFDISGEDLQEMENWTVRQLALVREACTFMSE